MQKPPIPPGIADQGQPKPAADPMFARFTEGTPAPSAEGQAAGAGEASWQTLAGKVDEFEKLTGQIYQMLEVLDKPSIALLGPIAEAGKALKKQVANANEERQKSAKVQASAAAGPDGGGANADKSGNPVESAPALAA